MTEPTRDETRKRRRSRITHPRGIGDWLLIAAMVLAFFVGVGHLVKFLFAETVSDIFGVRTISFWEAWGITLLSWILFKANVSTGAKR